MFEFHIEYWLVFVWLSSDEFLVDCQIVRTQKRKKLNLIFNLFSAWDLTLKSQFIEKMAITGYKYNLSIGELQFLRPTRTHVLCC